jgi:hypothetical protein
MLPEQRFQFGATATSSPTASTQARRPVFNRTVTLKDSWGKAG